MRIGMAAAVSGLALGLAIAPAAQARKVRHTPTAAASVSAPAPPEPPDAVAASLAQWVTATDDNHDHAFAIIDKVAARIWVFDAFGELTATAPVLVGSAVGDDSAPGVGEEKIADIPPDQRTTPAGRFVAGFAPSAEGRSVLWVDYADGISMHPVVTSNPKERRPQRLKSPTPDDNRISYGCINVAAGFYRTVIRPTFLDGRGVVYVLPEVKPVSVVFPRFATWTEAEAVPAALSPSAPAVAADASATQ